MREIEGAIVDKGENVDSAMHWKEADVQWGEAPGWRVVPDQQGLSGHEAEAVEIQRGPAGDPSKPDRVRLMEASEVNRFRCTGPGDSTNVSVR
jgi:hypothetical protein